MVHAAREHASRSEHMTRGSAAKRRVPGRAARIRHPPGWLPTTASSRARSPARPSPCGATRPRPAGGSWTSPEPSLQSRGLSGRADAVHAAPARWRSAWRATSQSSAQPTQCMQRQHDGAHQRDMWHRRHSQSGCIPRTLDRSSRATRAPSVAPCPPLAVGPRFAPLVSRRLCVSPFAFGRLRYARARQHVAACSASRCGHRIPRAMSGSPEGLHRAHYESPVAAR